MDSAPDPTVEVAIRDKFPGDDEAEHRVCLLRIHHAAERAQWALDSLGRSLADYINDPDPLYTGRLAQAAVETLATKLVSLAAELKKSSDRLLGIAQERYAAGRAGTD